MSFNDLHQRALDRRFQTDKDALYDDESKIGEGATNSTHMSPRGYVVKSIPYDWESKDPFEQEEIVNSVDRFPWVEVDELKSDAPYNTVMVRMNAADLPQNEVQSTFSVPDIIRDDMELLFDLRQNHAITYRDFKPDNLEYFWSEERDFERKPVDIFGGDAWEIEDALDTRKFAGIIDTYLTGTPDEEGLTDIYPLSVIDAEREVMELLGLDETQSDGDPYHDMIDALEASEYDFIE
ncbi:hypothetical protein [Candidatus Nanohalovita haloferacivicina]|uniref:hypothetical protein n=1 Tax=Candidatus Nanohalovita haloferacivicina TaxID=2978046 RepID=UPI00325F98A4|nr:hypothetical protein HBNXNv_1151 [Candidatus Nanohalobia archaeon BNXNv]